MKMSGNTILITGGGTGIGRGLAEAFHKLGNQVIIAGRRRSALDETIAANPGMEAIELDVSDPASIQAVAADVLARFPALNVLINNAGVMRLDDPGQQMDDDAVLSVLGTNLLGPIRLTSALIDQLRAQSEAAIVNVTSVMGYVPFARAATYGAGKAALHAYTLAQRFQLRDSNVAVIEIVPPRVQLDPTVSTGDVQSIPLADYIAAVMPELEAGNDEIVVELARPLRENVGPNERGLFNGINTALANSDIE